MRALTILASLLKLFLSNYSNIIKSIYKNVTSILFSEEIQKSL